MRGRTMVRWTDSTDVALRRRHLPRVSRARDGSCTGLCRKAGGARVAIHGWTVVPWTDITTVG